MDRKIFKLDDSVIAQIVKVIQLGFLTGSDVSDHMRQFRMEESVDGGLVLTPEYVAHDKAIVEKLLDEADTQDLPNDIN